MKIPMTATLVAPLHHGAGTSGNTSLLRTQQMTLPDATQVSVPFVSGSSVRHILRAALAWHLVATLDIKNQSLTRNIVDLLWSGGAITRTGPQTDLSLRARVREVLPLLSLLGYSAGADMAGSSLRVEHMHLVCDENRWRMPLELRETPQALKPAATYRSEEFGTRVDVGGSPVERYLAVVDDGPASTQMIYESQIVQPGAVMFGGVQLTPSASTEERLVCAAAISLAAPVGDDGSRTIWLGARSAVGYGQARLDVDLSPLDPGGVAVEWWESHLRDHADEVVPLLAEVVA